MGRWFAAVLLAVGALGCGKASLHADGATGTDGAADDEGGAPLTTRRSFDVVAQLRFTDMLPDGGVAPSAVPFSVTIDPEAGVMFAGGGGPSQVVPMSTRDARTFQADDLIRLALPSLNRCVLGGTSFSFTSLTLTMNGPTVTGTGTGTAQFVVNDTIAVFQFTATLAGGPDVTAPFLIGPTSVVDDPFERFNLAPSEPLPETATARLVGADGTEVPLVPLLSDGVPKIVVGFSKPPVVLPLAGGYQASVDVDFAGNRSSTPLRIVAFETPPLIAADGFESATGTVGGAAVVGPGPVPAIAGMKSVYLGAGAPEIGGVKAGPILFVRIPRRATDTRVRFSYRIVSRIIPVYFEGGIYVGSVGEPASLGGHLPREEDPTSVAPWDPWVELGGVHTYEYPLSGSVEGEVVFRIDQSELACNPGSVSAGLLVDDLRAE